MSNIAPNKPRKFQTTNATAFGQALVTAGVPDAKPVGSPLDLMVE